MQAAIGDQMRSPRGAFIVGSPIRYAAIGTEYDLHAVGPDGAFGTADDLRPDRIRVQHVIHTIPP